jgi:hypothetical protein
MRSGDLDGIVDGGVEDGYYFILGANILCDHLEVGFTARNDRKRYLLT